MLRLCSSMHDKIGVSNMVIPDQGILRTWKDDIHSAETYMANLPKHHVSFRIDMNFWLQPHS
jgi:hypothetical protein